MVNENLAEINSNLISDNVQDFVTIETNLFDIEFLLNYC